jgi:hypothetical protein
LLHLVAIMIMVVVSYLGMRELMFHYDTILKMMTMMREVKRRKRTMMIGMSEVRRRLRGGRWWVRHTMRVFQFPSIHRSKIEILI